MAEESETVPSDKQMTPGIEEVPPIIVASDAATQAALDAANAAAGIEEVPTLVIPPIETVSNLPVAVALPLEEIEVRASAAHDRIAIPLLAQEVQAEARKVDLLFKEISASAKRIQMTPKAMLAAVLTHAAHIAIRLSYDAPVALDDMIRALAEKAIKVGDRVKYSSNGAVGVVESFQEATGWAVVKWDHAAASPAAVEQLEKL